MSLVLDEPGGTITVTPSALATLVVHAAEAADGVQIRRGRRRLEVDFANGGARVRLEFIARYGVVLPELARDVQSRVADAVVTMCRVNVESVDVSVEGIE
jgi:uncharacterized alkaline shock family protein YloU